MSNKCMISKPSECSICGTYEGRISPCENEYVCEACLEKGRKGRDQTTRAARATRLGMQNQATAAKFRLHGDTNNAENHERMAADLCDRAESHWEVKELSAVVLGESVPKRNSPIKNTLTAPDAAALDASAHRLELLGRLGTDCAALALDAANSIQAENSLEKMLAHQLAAAHKAALEILGKAMLQRDTTERIRLLNASNRMMNTFQQGLLTLHRIRSKGEQHIIVQHVTVTNGGQAIVGNVSRGGRGQE